MKPIMLPSSMYRDKRRTLHQSAGAVEVLSADCKTERWWQLAGEWPWAAMRSPLFDLLTLENPERWIELESTHAPRWVHAYCSRLDHWRHAVFLLHCAAHVLPGIPEGSSHRLLATEALEMMSTLLRNKRNSDNILRHKGLAMAERLEHACLGEAQPVHFPLQSAASALRLRWHAYLHAQAGTAGHSPSHEAIWQWKHLQGFLRKEQS